MTAETGAQGSGLALDLDGRAHQIEFRSSEDKERVTALLADRQQVRVQIDPIADADTEGHVLATKAMVSLRLRVQSRTARRRYLIAANLPKPTQKPTRLVLATAARSSGSTSSAKNRYLGAPACF